jgi:hypothetical protein
LSIWVLLSCGRFRPLFNVSNRMLRRVADGNVLGARIPNVRAVTLRVSGAAQIVGTH